jgi:hypothetical protein
MGGTFIRVLSFCNEDNSQVGIIVDGTENTDASTAANSGAV